MPPPRHGAALVLGLGIATLASGCGDDSDADPTGGTEYVPRGHTT